MTRLIWVRSLLAVLIALAVAAGAWLAVSLFGEAPETERRGLATLRTVQVTPTVEATRTIEVPVPATGSLAEWEADLAERERVVNEWIEHLQGREKAIKAAEQECGL